MRKIAIIGAGNMGGSIARGILGGKLCGDYEVRLANSSTDKLEKIKAEFPSAVISTSNADAVAGADIIILAVKPWIVRQVIDEIHTSVDIEDVTFVSLAAGITIGDICDMFDNSLQAAYSVTRAMPNTAIAVGESMTFICGDQAAKDKVDELNMIFGSMGRSAVIPERMMGAAMALCSCGIAYGMRYVRAATEGAVELGLYPDAAKEYIFQTLRGAVALLEATGANPEVEIDKVTTPGGVTIKGLNAMERNGFTSAVIEGLKASSC